MKMKLQALLLSGLLLAPAATRAADAVSKSEIEATIRAYLLEHPELLLDMSQALEKKQAEARRVQAKTALTAHRDALLADAKTPSFGKAASPVTIVEFFDYRCGYCKRVSPTVKKLMEEDPSIRVVFKELPILGPESSVAALAALAAHEQGGYLKFHQALMAASEFTPEVISDLAKKSGLDTERLQKDMAKPELQAALAQNRTLSEALAIQATPAFVIGDEVVPGALSEEAFKGLIAKAKAQAQPMAAR
ncbi:MAG: DsbA family protein [Bryobacteraceae bacterium]